MSKTFLQLANALAQECRISGNAATISTVVGQTGTALRLVNWLIESYNEIQQRSPAWLWLRSTFSFPTVAHTDTYAFGACTDTLVGGAITRFRSWIPFGVQGESNVSRYLTSGGVSGQMWMVYLPWHVFRAMYKFGPQQSNYGPIVHITVTPQNKWMLGPNPDAVYTIGGEYQMSSQVLAVDADVPEMPGDYHDLIVYRAMEKYGRAQAAIEVLARGQAEGHKLMTALEQNQLPMMSLGEPLA